MDEGDSEGIAGRGSLQLALDGQRTQAQRNAAGQFATPWPLALEVVAAGVEALPAGTPIRFLDPAFGLGTFFDALLSQLGSRRLEAALAFEKDPHYGLPATRLWAGHPLLLRLEDFTLAEPPARGFNLVVCNPPYVRHHHLDRETKRRLQAAVKARAGLSISGLAGLYAHFLLLSLSWMEQDGIGVWLVPGELMDVGYGRVLRRFLTEQVELLRIHRADPTEVQFGDALVSSVVVVLRRRAPGRAAVFSFGGRLSSPLTSREIPLDLLGRSEKWTSLLSATPQASGTPLSALFTIRRGIATGGNDFFIRPLDAWKAVGVPAELLVPILPGPRHMPLLEVEADAEGLPRIASSLFLLRCKAAPQSPALLALLREAEPTIGQGYLCRHRNPWYSQETRDPAPLLCTYMGRSKVDGHPFRFILNHSQAIATNVYLLLYPKEQVWGPGRIEAGRLRPLWRYLNGLTATEITAAGRVYGGGLHKLEPGELGSIRVPDRILGEMGLVSS